MGSLACRAAIELWMTGGREARRFAVRGWAEVLRAPAAALAAACVESRAAALEVLACGALRCSCIKLWCS